MNIHTQDMMVSPSLHEFVSERLGRALRGLDVYPQQVDVFLKDLNGPKGGADKAVLVRIRLCQRLVVTVEAIRSDPYAAVHIAARRARRSVKRALRKRRRLERKVSRQATLAAAPR